MSAEISDEKRKQMNDLYHQAVRYRRAQLEFFDRVSEKTLKDLQFEGRMLEDLLTCINDGNNPVCFISRTGAICKTAAMLSQ